jgi:hypothetical protein
MRVNLFCIQNLSVKRADVNDLGGSRFVIRGSGFPKVAEKPYRARARSDPHRVTTHEQHAHYNKDKVIVSATKAIIARFFVVVIL